MTGALLLSDTFAARYAAELDRAAPGVPRILVTPDGPTGEKADVEAAFFSGDLYPERVTEYMSVVVRCKQLKWLHSSSAGVDHPVFLGLQDRGVRISHSAGAHAVPIGQTVAMFILALSRDFPAWMDAQRRKAWEGHRVQELPGKVLGVLGLGHIGAEVAKLGAALGMRVIGMRRTPRGDEPCETWPIDRLDDLLGIADYLVLTMALNNESRHILSAAAIARMKPQAYVINIARGELIDEPALIAALHEGRIAGAALDVFEEEPLAAANPLWEMPNVIITPHNSGSTPGNAHRAAEIFLANLGRYVRGEPLRNEMPPRFQQAQ